MTESVVDYNEQPLAVEVDATTMICHHHDL